MIIAILLYRIDTSRLRFTAFDNKVDIIDIINIEKKKAWRENRTFIFNVWN